MWIFFTNIVFFINNYIYLKKIMAVTGKSTKGTKNSVTKVTFGKRKIGKAKKRRSKRETKMSTYRGQGR